MIREPGGTVISEQIREILLNRDHAEMTDICEVFLYSAARNQLVVEKIVPELEAGNVVIADRFVDSTTAYQGAGRGIHLDLIRDINRAATSGLLPGITFFLDIEPAKMAERKKSRNAQADRLEESGMTFYHRVREGYQQIASLDPQRVKVIDADLGVKEIENIIWEYVSLKLNFNR
ncbi:MAG: dTMP kinase [Calditrichales bacterium]|nr:MAG: dTMP kinase [Calditrichales bacterium]